MIVTEGSIRVNVPPIAAYGHLVRFDEYPRFMSGVLGLTADRAGAHMALDIGGRRVELDAVFSDMEPGRFVRWNSAVLTEMFRLEEAGGGTDVAAVLQLDDDLVHVYDQSPEVVMRNRLRVDLKGLKRLCEEQARHREP